MPPAEFPRAQAIERRLLCSCPLMGREPCAPPRKFQFLGGSQFSPGGAVARRFRSIATALTTTGTSLKKDIERPNRRIEFVCFVKTGIALVVAVQSETRVRSRSHRPRRDDRNCRGAGWSKTMDARRQPCQICSRG